jgi:hypothetical protein
MSDLNILEFPNDILKNILKHLEFQHLLNTILVNKRFQKLSKNFLWSTITDEHTNFEDFEDLLKKYGDLVNTIDILYWMEDMDLAKAVEYTPNLKKLNCELKSLEELITISFACPNLKSSRLCLKDIEGEFDTINPYTLQPEEAEYTDKLPIKLENLHMWNSQGPIFALDFLDISSLKELNLMFYDELTPSLMNRLLEEAPQLSKLGVVLGVPNGGNFEVDVSDVIYEFKRPLPNLTEVSLQFAGWNLMNVSHFRAVVPFNPKLITNLTTLKLGLSTTPPEDDFLKELCCRYLNDLINQNWSKLTKLSTFCASEETIEILKKSQFEGLKELEIMCVLEPTQTLNSLLNAGLTLETLIINESELVADKLEFEKELSTLKSLTICRNEVNLALIELIMNRIPNLEELLLLQAPFSTEALDYIDKFGDKPSLTQLKRVTFGNSTSEYFRSALMPKLHFDKIQKLLFNSPQLVQINLWEETSRTIEECKQYVKFTNSSLSICILIPIIIRLPFGNSFTFKSLHISNYLNDGWNCGHIHPTSSRLNFP